MKLLIHAINGVGLGHLVRTLEIAKALLAKTEEAEIIFVTNSAFPDLIVKEGFRVYRLKYHTNMVLDGTMTYETYLQANYLRIRALIKKEQPDMVLMDSEFNGPLVVFCHENKIKICFVLRKTTDQNFKHLSQKGFLDKLDLVLVPHTEEEVSPGQRDILSKYRSVHFVGPILRSAGEARKMIKDGIFRVLITLAAGSDIPENKEIYSKVSDFLVELKKRKMRICAKEISVTIVTGPFFKEKACDLHGFDHKKFEHNLPGVMSASDLIISPAGYNLINEIILTKIPALLIPVPRNEDDQFARARSLEDKGCAVIVRSTIWRALEDMVRQDKLDTMRGAFPSIAPGNAAAAKRIIELIQDKTRVLILRGQWLPLSERFISDEVSCLRKYEPVVLCLENNSRTETKFDVLSDRRFSGLWTKDYPALPKEKIKLQALMMRWASLLVRSRHIKILHAQFLSDAVFFMGLKELCGLPLVVSVRGYDLYAQRGIDLRLVFSAADVLLVRSQIMKNDLIKLGCPARKIQVRHSGIFLPDHALWQERPAGEIRILMAGRLVAKKGTLFGLRVFNELCQKFDNLRLFIVGDGPLREDLLHEIEQSPFSAKMTYLKEMPNDKVLELMGTCHILFHPSMTAPDGDKEGIPGVIMEAMSCGLLTVASDNGSITEIVQDQRTGFVFKEADAGHAFEKMAFAVSNIGGWEKLKANALEMVKGGFNVVQETSKLEEVYDSLWKDGQLLKYEKYYSNYQAVAEQDRPQFFRADIHPVRGCNSYCVMCDYWKEPKSEFLSRRQIFDTLQKLKDLGAREIRFHGHEPTLRSDLLDLIDHAKSLGLWVGLKTNCVGLDKNYCKRLAALDELYVSIDSPLPSMHNKIRGNKGSFKDNLKVMAWLKAQKPSILLESNSVVTRMNYRTLAKMPDFAHRTGISKISFVMLNNKNKHEVANLLLKKEQMEEFYFQIVPVIIGDCLRLGIGFDFSPFFADLVLEDPQKMISELKGHPEKFSEEIENYLDMEYGKTFYRKYGCHGPLDHASINYDGNVYPCCVVERKEPFAMGNIAKASFDQIWDSEKYKRIRKSTINSRGTCCAHYATCGSNFNSRKYLAGKIR